jgi:peptide/nickel transport system ATP-binding protein
MNALCIDTPAPLLRLDDLRVGLRTPEGLLQAVDGITFEIRSGEIVGVVGESGSGKTVTALSILRMLDPRVAETSGRIIFEGSDILAMRKPELRQLRGGRIAMVFQNPMASLNPVLRIGDQIVEGMLCHGELSSSNAKARAIGLLREMGLTAPEEAIDRYQHQFSGGMRQRIMLAMGFANSPALLIADEPTTALDVTIQAQILDLLRELNTGFGTAVLLITHDLGVVASICSRLNVMYCGKIVEEGPTASVLRDPRHPYTQALIAAVPRIDGAPRFRRPLVSIGGSAPRRSARQAGCSFRNRCWRVTEKCAEEPPLNPVSVDSRAACWHASSTPSAPEMPEEYPAPSPLPAAERDILLSLQSVTKHYPLAKRRPWERRRQAHALDDVSLDVRRGETLGLVGESGSGKSTLARLAVRLQQPTGGRVMFEGRDLATMSPAELRPHRRHLQMVFQDPYSSLNPRMTVGSAVAEPMLLHSLVSDRREAGRRVCELLARVGLDPNAGRRYPYELSGGQRQRVAIARALAAEPKLIVADEPISSLDVNIQAQILNLLLQLQDEQDLTYVFISHNLAVVRQIAHRVAVLYLGKIVEIANPSMLFKRPLHPYTKSLIAAVPIPEVVAERARRAQHLRGEVPTIVDPPGGCRFRTRCPIAKPICAEKAPVLNELGSGQSAACHFAGQF